MTLLMKTFCETSVITMWKEVLWSNSSLMMLQKKFSWCRKKKFLRCKGSFHRGVFKSANVRRQIKSTIRDVAAKANVSITTVSRVLNKPEMVDPDTRLKVHQAIESLDFKPSAIARGLRSAQSNTIGLLVPGIQEFFFDELYEGIQREANEHDVKILLYEAKYSSNLAVEGFTFLRQHEVDGIIFSSHHVNEDYDAVLERLDLPVVLTLTEATGRVKLPAFRTDEIRAMFDVVGYLVSRGHRRIGFIGAETGLARQLRFQGYRQGLAHYGLEFDENAVVNGDFRFNSGYKAMETLLSRQSSNKLTAVCAISDEMAIGAMRYLYDHGLNVPNDMSVVGFDNIRISEMVMPGLTTVAQPFAEIGVRALRTVLQMTEDPAEPGPVGVHYLSHHLVERGSVAHIHDEKV